MRPVGPAILMFVVSSVAAAQVTQKHESFDDDPGWRSYNSVVAPQQFGWCPETDHAGGAAPGEVGGRLSRGSSSYYAGDVGKLDPSKQTLRARAKMARKMQGNILFGWFDSATVEGRWEAAPGTFIGLGTNDDQLYATALIGGNIVYQEGPIVSRSADPFAIEMDYAPDGNDGLSVLTLEVRDLEGNAVGKASVRLTAGEEDQLADLDRFGLLSVHSPGGPFELVFFDDLEYTAGPAGGRKEYEVEGVTVNMGGGTSKIPPKLLSQPNGPLQV